ncbi:substrate-binding domain-containing protein, partial [Dialister micraerophilus]
MLKKVALACMIGAALVSVAGCGSSDKKDAATSDKKITVGFSVSTQNNPFFVTMANSVKAEADKLGINVKIVDAQNDSAKQANDVADLIQSKVDVLIVNPVDSAAISNSVIAANQAKIPVITIDRSSDKGDVAVHIASNNVKGGEMAAQYIIDKLGEQTPVAELEG